MPLTLHNVGVASRKKFAKNLAAALASAKQSKKVLLGTPSKKSTTYKLTSAKGGKTRKNRK